MTDGGDLAGKAAIVTGGATGIGAAIVRALAARGAEVFVNCMAGQSLPDLPVNGGRSVAVAADISKLEEIRRLFDAVGRQSDRLDILINNAAVFPRSDALELDEETWDRTLDTNLKGAFFCAQAAARIMRCNGGGRIVNIASEAAYKGSVRGAAYAASKAGLVALTRSLARAFARDSILVNAVAPGVTDTAQSQLSEEQRRAHTESIPLGRVGQPLDVARAVMFLVSQDSAYVTGQTIHVNGGDLMVS